MLKRISVISIILFSAKAVAKYDMKCACGVRNVDEESERDCEESARLESGDEEWKI